MRASLSLGAAVAVATALLAVLSCLPDLAALPTEAGPPGAGLCGNAIVDFDAHGGGEQGDPGGAAVLGCTDCKVTCEGTADPVTNHCYFTTQPSGVDFRSAQLACGRARAHVVTLGSDEERRLVDGLVGMQSYWVGLRFATDQEPAFTVAAATGSAITTVIETGWPQPPCRGPCTGCYGFGLDGGGFALPDGGAVAIDDGGLSCAPANQDEACVASLAGPSPKWVQVTCGHPELMPPPVTVCEREPPGAIQIQFCGGDPCFSIRASAKLYDVHKDLVDGKNIDCGPGGRLLHIDSDRERLEIVRTLGDIPPNELPTNGDVSSFWVGLSFTAGQWTWDDGSPASDLHLWGDGQPATNAGRAVLRLDSAYDSGLLYSTNGELNGYICESDLP